MLSSRLFQGVSWMRPHSNRNKKKASLTEIGIKTKKKWRSKCTILVVNENPPLLYLSFCLSYCNDWLVMYSLEQSSTILIIIEQIKQFTPVNSVQYSVPQQVVLFKYYCVDISKLNYLFNYLSNKACSLKGFWNIWTPVLLPLRIYPLVLFVFAYTLFNIKELTWTAYQYWNKYGLLI